MASNNLEALGMIETKGLTALIEACDAMMKSAKPFWEFFGTMRMRLLQNVDDPGRFIQVIDYEADEAVELNRQRIAGDTRMQGFIQAWRSMLPGAIEIDVYEEV